VYAIRRRAADFLLALINPAQSREKESIEIERTAPRDGRSPPPTRPFNGTLEVARLIARVASKRTREPARRVNHSRTCAPR